MKALQPLLLGSLNAHILVSHHSPHLKVLPDSYQRKISRDMEVDELLEVLQKGAPAFETAHSVFELGQTIEKLIVAMRHVAHRQATLEDQVKIMTDNLTKVVDSLEKAMQPKEPAPREEPAPRDQVPFYS